MSYLTQCNYCGVRDLKQRHPTNLIALRKKSALGTWTNYYLNNEAPAKGQDKPYAHNGKPICFVAGFLEIPDRCCC